MRLPTLTPMLAVAVLIAAPARAQIVFTPAAGISKDIRTETANHWKLGPSIGASIFKKGSKSISWGVRAFWHHWSVDADGWAEDEPTLNGVNYTITSSSGSQSVIEVAPSMMFPITKSSGSVNLHGQIGVGLVYVGASDVTLEGNFSSPGQSGSGSISTSTDSEIGFGGYVALPISLGKVFQLIPSISAYNTNDFYSHFGLALGFKFGK